MAIKSSILPELHAFMATIPDDIPYIALPKLARDAGWLWRLKQLSEVYAPGRVLLTFEVQIGKDAAALETLDRVSVQVPDGIPQISLAARTMLDQTLIYLVTGRLPPAAPVPTHAPAQDTAPRQQAPAQRIDMNDDDFELQQDPDTGEDTEVAAAPKLPAIVGSQTPDGVPVLDDLYALDVPPERVLAALFSAIEEFMPRATTIEMLNTFWKKNEREFAFVQDFGTATDKARLPKLFKERQAILATMAPAEANVPRRRPAR